GLVSAYAISQFAIGNTNFSDFSFDVTFNLLDDHITSAISGGDLVRGDASASGIDPVVWTFVNETDNSFGNLMTFGPVGGSIPNVQLSATDVPEPAHALLLATGALLLIAARPLRRIRRRAPL
ncbi:MAG: hypothetical protein ACR2PQ_09975, partial [Myxococcota bacterium]